MNRILTYNTIKNEYWWQMGENTFTVGQLTSSYVLDAIINNARSDGAFILDTSKIDPKVYDRLVSKYFNGRGVTDDVEEYREALLLNGAEEIK